MRHTSRLGASLRYAFLPVGVLIFSFVLGRTAYGQAPSASSAQSDQRVTSPLLPTAWNDGVKTLAEKIATLVKPSRAISLEIKNISSLGPADVEAIRKTLEAELANLGSRLGSAGVGVEVTLSENVKGYVWVAEVGKDTPRLAGLVQVAKVKDLLSRLVPTPVIQRRIVWRDDNQVLDFEAHDALLGAIEISHRTLWSETGIQSYSLGFDKEIRKDKEELIPKFPRQRDVRGLLSDRKGENLRAYFGYVQCLDSYQLLCAENSSQEWPIGVNVEARFVGNRNYFDGLNRAPGKKWPEFFSLADNKWITDGGELWIQAEIDGKSRAYNNDSDAFKPLSTFSGWGDDIASIDLPCGPVWEVLVSGTGDWTEPDRLQVYQIDEHYSAQPAGEPLSFPGPILAMWPSEDGKAARIVSKNLQTGEYEASIVTIACSQ
jgi:hypothetical protein